MFLGFQKRTKTANKGADVKWSLSKTRLLLVCCMIVLSTGLSFILPPPAKANPLYSCGNLSSGHCYAIADWPGTVEGSYTAIFTNQMHAGDGFVNNEMWLIQAGSTSYWVEIGTKAQSGAYNGNEILFWSDQRPNGGGYSNHYGPKLSSSDFGKFSYFEISKDSGSSFAVIAYGLPVASISGESTANPITPNDIQVGMELAGSSGATAPTNGFDLNEWQSVTDNSWNWQNNTGVPVIPDPPTVGYWQNQPNGAGNQGGEWRTCLNSNC